MKKKIEYIIEFSDDININKHLMTSMENLEQKFEELSKHIPDYETDVWSAINALENASFSAVEKGQKKLEIAISRLNEVDELISSAFSMFPLSPRANTRLTQCLVSVRPRLNSYIEQLKSLIANPPTESKYGEVDDIENYLEEESQDNNEQISENNKEQNENNDQNELTNSIQNSCSIQNENNDQQNERKNLPIDRNDDIEKNDDSGDKNNNLIENQEMQQNELKEKNETEQINSQNDEN